MLPNRRIPSENGFATSPTKFNHEQQGSQEQNRAEEVLDVVDKAVVLDADVLDEHEDEQAKRDCRTRRRRRRFERRDKAQQVGDNDIQEERHHQGQVLLAALAERTGKLLPQPVQHVFHEVLETFWVAGLGLGPGDEADRNQNNSSNQAVKRINPPVQKNHNLIRTFVICQPAHDGRVTPI